MSLCSSMIGSRVADLLSCSLTVEWTVMLVTARSRDSRMRSRVALDRARRRTDDSLSYLSTWPFYYDNQATPLTSDPDRRSLLRSRPYFEAVLRSHRDSVDAGGAIYFRDELQFYGDVIDELVGRLNRGCGIRGRLLPWLHSYGYLMGVVSYVGAEQGLCSSVALVCFSHRESFVYIQLSFSAEALFRLFRQSYPNGGRRTAQQPPVHNEDHPDQEDHSDPEDHLEWRVRAHSSFFPLLSLCRRQTMNDVLSFGSLADSLPSSACGKSGTAGAGAGKGRRGGRKKGGEAAATLEGAGTTGGRTGGGEIRGAGKERGAKVGRRETAYGGVGQGGAGGAGEIGKGGGGEGGEGGGSDGLKNETPWSMEEGEEVDEDEEESTLTGLEEQRIREQVNQAMEREQRVARRRLVLSVCLLIACGLYIASVAIVVPLALTRWAPRDTTTTTTTTGRMTSRRRKSNRRRRRRSEGNTSNGRILVGSCSGATSHPVVVAVASSSSSSSSSLSAAAAEAATQDAIGDESKHLANAQHPATESTRPTHPPTYPLTDQVTLP